MQNTDEALEWSMERPPELYMSNREKDLCDRFVTEYLQDYDWYDAAVRVGYPEGYAKDYAMRFKENPYVQRRIAQAKIAAPHDVEGVETEQRRKIINLLMKEANYHGPGSTHGGRVAALAKLTSIFGMDAPTKNESLVTHEGGTTMEHTFDYGNLDKDGLAMVRKLLEGQVEGEDDGA